MDRKELLISIRRGFSWLTGQDNFPCLRVDTTQDNTFVTILESPVRPRVEQLFLSAAQLINGSEVADWAKHLDQFAGRDYASIVDQRISEPDSGKRERFINLSDAASLSIVAIDQLMKSLEASTTSAINDACVYLGNGRLRVNGKVEMLTAGDQIKVIEVLLAGNGVASFADFTGAQVANPSRTFDDLLAWKDGILSPYILRPSRRGDGYRTTIIDARVAEDPVASP